MEWEVSLEERERALAEEKAAETARRQCHLDEEAKEKAQKMENFKQKWSHLDLNA